MTATGRAAMTELTTVRRRNLDVHTSFDVLPRTARPIGPAAAAAIATKTPGAHHTDTTAPAAPTRPSSLLTAPPPHQRRANRTVEPGR